MSRLLVAMVLALSAFTTRADILSGYDSIDEFRLVDSGWMAALIGTESYWLQGPTSTVASRNLVYFLDDGHNSLYVYDVSTQSAKTMDSAYRMVDGKTARLYLGPHHQLYVIDSFGNQVLQFGFNGDFVTRYVDPMNLNTPVGVCVNPHNKNVMIADSYYSHIIEFGQDGSPLALHGLRSRSGAQAGNNIVAMACTEEAMYVVSKLSYDINVFNYAGQLLHKISRKEVRNPTSIAVDQYGRIYVSDFHNDQIHVYNEKGYIESYGGMGSEMMSFRDIKSLWVDGNFLYVSDSMNRRIQILNINHPSQSNLRYAP